MLAVWGAHDEVTPEADLRRIAEDVQHGRPVGLADAAHLPPADDAVGTAAVLREFFDAFAGQATQVEGAVHDQT